MKYKLKNDFDISPASLKPKDVFITDSSDGLFFKTNSNNYVDLVSGDVIMGFSFQVKARIVRGSFVEE